MNYKQNNFRDAIDALSERYRLALKEIDSVEEYSNEQVIDEAFSLGAVYNLAELPIEEWGDLRVSNLSVFKDWSWDFREQGSPLYKDATFLNWDVVFPDSSSDSDRYAMLLTCIRALLFYMLPTNTMIKNIKSYNSVIGNSKHLSVVARFLKAVNVYCDDNGNGAVKTADDLTKQNFHDYLNSLERNSEKYSFVTQVLHWHELSIAGLLPPVFQLSTNVFSKEDASKVTKVFDESKGQYLPIHIDTLTTMLPYSIEIVENCSEEILALYNIMWPIAAGGEALRKSGFLWSEAIDQLEGINAVTWDINDFVDREKTMSSPIKIKLCHEIKRRGIWEGSVSKLQQLPVKKVVAIAEKGGIDLYEFNKEIYYDKIKLKNLAKKLPSVLRNSVAFIVFLVTGMRRSEFANLKADSFWKVKGKEEYNLRVTIYKTSDSSQGEDHVVPIPKIAYIALERLRELTEQARKASGEDRLAVNFTNNFGEPMTLNAINQFFQRWSEYMSVEHIHPHQFRKTIAMFAIYQDTANLPIIKKLFGHKSLKMTLAYIVKMPGVAHEIKIALLEQNKDLLVELLESAESGVIAGIAGKRIEKNFKEEKIYSAMLHDDGWETLEQYVDILLNEGVTLLHRAPMKVICIKTPAIEQSAPCDANKSDKVARLHPDIQKCSSTECQWSVFTEKSEPLLENEIVFHEEISKHPYSSKAQIEFSQKRIQVASKYLKELRDGKKLGRNSSAVLKSVL